MSKRRGDFFILNENPTQCRGLADFVNPLPGGGGGGPDPLTNTSHPPPSACVCLFVLVYSWVGMPGHLCVCVCDGVMVCVMV